MKTDIEIAQESEMLPISEVAKRAGLDAKYVEEYGGYKAKINYDFLRENSDKPDGKLILVTAINPTPAGEGKTTTSVGLADGLSRLGKKTVVAVSGVGKVNAAICTQTMILKFNRNCRAFIKLAFKLECAAVIGYGVLND